MGRFGLALRIPNQPNMLRNGEEITIFMQVCLFPTDCNVISCFVGKMSKITITSFGGQVQLDKSMVGRLDDSGAREGAR